MAGLTATRPDPPGASELDALAALALKNAQSQAEAFTTRLQQALEAAIESAPDIEQQEAARHAAAALRKKPREYQRLLASSLQEGLRQAVGALVESGVSPLERGAMDLSAATFEAMQEKVLLENLAGAIDKGNATALDALGVRIGVLLGRELGTAANPFRAATFLSAALGAWQRFDFDPAASRAVLRQFRPEVFLQLDALLQSLNQLVAASAPQDTGASQESSPKPALRRRRGDSMLGKLQQWLAPRVPSHSKTQRGQGIHPALLDYLTDLQKLPITTDTPDANVLRRVLDEAPSVAFSTLDRNAVELLAAAFELIFAEAPLMPEIKKLLERLQVPVLKSALADKDFFFTPEHPARNLLEAVARAGRACDPVQGKDDPLYQKLERTVERVVREFIDQTELFDHLARRLEAWMAREEKATGSKVETAIASALKQEEVHLALQEAADMIESRLEDGDVAGFVETFLRERWVQVLANALRRRSSNPQAAADVQSTMEKLIWSVKPKASPEERRELVASLPGLIGALVSALDAIGWKDAERDTFFAALAERHAAVARTPLESMPRQQLEIAMNLAQKASERRLQRRALEQQEKSVDEFVKSVDALVPGCRVDFKRPNNTALRCRLSWVSPERTRFVFHARPTQQVFVLASDMLAQLLRNGQASRVSTDDLVTRALAGALTEMEVDE